MPCFVSTLSIMIDPSLLVVNRFDTHELLEWVSENHATFNFYIPQSFVRAVESSPPEGVSPTAQFFLGDLDTKQIMKLVGGLSPYVKKFEMRGELRTKYQEFYRTLSIHVQPNLDSGGLLNAVFEEWVFLNEMSAIVARIRKAFDTFVRVGATAMYTGGRVGSEGIQQIVRRSLHLSKETQLTRASYRRAGIKWIALGGGALTAQFTFPWISPGVAAFASGVFWLLDP